MIHLMCAAQKSDKQKKSLVIGGRSFASTVMAQYDEFCRRITLHKQYIKLVKASRKYEQIIVDLIRQAQLNINISFHLISKHI